ncbi:polysaccharide biosynthesis protein [Phaeobacter gallaeciensis]|uniref:Capsular polysaccharide biosynthesis protein n=1 Tax=Phaeobacter gallaeciensis TaxID=60890 RepID=A0AAC9ZDT3_9RHOB|nr:nucleoside-diphosphate sugar epimerase/dehydratase [Phaeobacter gallaeciensis]AHD12101.1 putative nucleoside-diphosphate sugar epimerase [Phaeobacter gallaeciensis DSM 26640]ATE95285.1 putative capsular polysaccharide biosynthesis protein [Phaeobacter gallaeciensis]ATE99675.1 putative capsular polysaccharide biosynthesis protein [Phaeobacter gallaeciensis]ATF03989.1 putative capsular polysaccharide biosynthesis protein [Phaeobacter gallaeciensis]ATF08265.1 putative capsular polysaccharide b
MFNLISALSRKQKSYIFLTIDLTLIPLALFLTFLVLPLPGSALATLAAMLPVLPYVLALAAAVALWLGLPKVQLNAYERHAVGLTALLASITAGATAGLTLLFGPDLPPGTHVVFATTYFLCLLAARAVLYQLVVAIYRRAQPRCRVLIYGAGTTGAQLAQALKAHDGIDPVAFVDDNTSLQGVTLVGLPVFPPARIAEIAEARQIKRVLLAMPSQSQPKQAQIIQRLQRMQLEVQALPSFAQLIGEEALVDKLTPVAPQNFLGRATRDVPLQEASGSYQDRVVLVSGAGGSIGSELCRQVLACQPRKLVLYELSELALYTIHQELEQQVEGTGIELVPVLGSVTDPRQVRMVLAHHGVQVVLHAAAYKHVPLVEANPLPGLANNVFGTQTLARAAARSGVERFILISSDKAVRPTNVMGASKRMAELVVQDLATRNPGTVFTMVRFGNVLGSSGSVVPLFQEQISRGGPVTVTDPRVKRYFMTIREAVQLVLQAGAEALGGEVFVLDMGEPISILQLARQVIESAGYSVRDDDHPDGDIAIDIIGLRPGEKMQEELTLSSDLITTRHQKIFCAREAVLSEIEVATLIRGLRQAVAAGDERVARALIKRWVEGYRAPEEGRKTS